MKRIILVFLAFALLCVFMAVAVMAAERPEVDSSGKVYISEAESRRPLTAEEEQAFKNPGKEIPVDLRNIKAERDAFSWPGFFYIIPVQEYSRVVVYDPGKQAIITLKKKGKIYGDKTLALYVFLLVAAIMFVAGSNILFICKNKPATLVATLIATIVSTLAAALAAALAALLASFAVAVLGKEKAYKIFSAAFYVAAAIAMFV